MRFDVTRQGSEAMPIASARDESLRRDASLRILVLDASPSCRFTVTTGDSTGDSIERVEITEATRADFERHTPDDWDIIITHVHASGVEGSAVVPELVEAEPPRSAFLRHKSDRSKVIWLRAEAVRGWRKLFRRLFPREQLSPIEQEKQRATQTMVLSEMQRTIGVALSAIEMGDFDSIGEIACRLRDDATNYDFAKLSGLGAALYDTVPNRDIRTARNIAQKLMTYMGKTIGYYLA